MIHRVESNSIKDYSGLSSGINKVKRDKSVNIPSIKDYMLSDENMYNERYLHRISHVKIDNDDVVVYYNDVNISNANNKINGVTTVIKEQLRIPKEEVKALIKELLSEDN